MGIVIGSFFVFAVAVTSARADSVHSMWFIEGLERDRLSFNTHIDFGLRHIGYLRREHLDNGRHLGFFKSEQVSAVSTASPVSTVSSASTFSFSDANQSREYLGGAIVEKNPQLTIVSSGRQTSVTPNPEPTTVLLLGSGLVALGAYARRKFQPLIKGTEVYSGALSETTTPFSFSRHSANKKVGTAITIRNLCLDSSPPSLPGHRLTLITPFAIKPALVCCVDVGNPLDVIPQ